LWEWRDWKRRAGGYVRGDGKRGGGLWKGNGYDTGECEWRIILGRRLI
jgi:hypothetical protein